MSSCCGCGCSCRYLCCRQAISYLAVAPKNPFLIFDPKTAIKVNLSYNKKDGDMIPLIKATQNPSTQDINQLLTTNTWTNINLGWFRNSYVDLSSPITQQIQLSARDGIISPSQYYTWLQLLRSDQQWWDSSCEYFWKSLVWLILRIIFGAVGMVLFIIAFVFLMLYVLLCTPKYLLTCNKDNLRASGSLTKFGGVFTIKPSFYDTYLIYIFRLPTYLISMIFRSIYSCTKWLSGASKAALMPDGAILVSLMTGPISRDLQVNIGGKLIPVCDINVDTQYKSSNLIHGKVELKVDGGDIEMKEFKDDVADKQDFRGYFIDFARVPTPSVQKMTLFPGNYLQAKSLEIFEVPSGDDSKELQYKIIMLDQEGKEHTIIRPDPHKKDEPGYEEELRKWELAKAHVQIILCWYPPAWTHNFVHFHLLDVILQRMALTTSPQTVFGTLLRTHLRYTGYMNVAGPADGWANPSGPYNCLVRAIPWKIQPENPQMFANTLAQNTVYYYLEYNEDSCRYRVKNVFPPLWVTLREYYGPTNKNNNPEARKWRGLVPYLDMVADYYFVIRKYVKTLWEPIANITDVDDADKKGLDPSISLLEHDAFEQWLRDADLNGLPGLRDEKKYDPIDIISTIIWTATVQHAADHLVYYDIFKNFPMYSAKLPWTGNGTWKDVLRNGWWTVQNYAYHVRVCTDVYVGYRYSFLKFIAQDTLTSSGLYGHWCSILDKNQRNLLNKIHQNFLKDLENMNSNWGWMLDINALPCSTSF